MASLKKSIQETWNIDGLASDLGGEEWHITEGPRGQNDLVRIDRMVFIAPYHKIEDLAKDTLTKKELKEAKASDTLPELLQDATDEYVNELAEQVGKAMGEHVYGTFEEGDAFLGQYEEGPFSELYEKWGIAYDDIKYHGLNGASMGASMSTRDERAKIQAFVRDHLVKQGLTPGEAYSYTDAWVWDNFESWPPLAKDRAKKAIDKALWHYRRSSSGR